MANKPATRVNYYHDSRYVSGLAEVVAQDHRIPADKRDKLERLCVELSQELLGALPRDRGNHGDAA